jgi:hypothetical protein
VLDDIAVRPFLEEPARENAVPLIVPAFAHVELNESAGFGGFLPRCGLLAGAQADDRIVHAKGLARLHLERASDAVAFVEDADFCDALRHRRAGQPAIAGRDRIAGHFLRIACVGVIAGCLARTASRESQQRWSDESGHDEAAARRDAPEGA